MQNQPTHKHTDTHTHAHAHAYTHEHTHTHTQEVYTIAIWFADLVVSLVIALLLGV